MMQRGQQINLHTSVDQCMKDKLISQKKYFTKAPNPQLTLSFSNPFSPPKYFKPNLTPTAKSTQYFALNPIQTKSTSHIPKLSFAESISKVEKEEIICALGTPRKQCQSISKEKQQALRSTDATQCSVLNQFQTLLSSNSGKEEQPSQGIKQNKNNIGPKIQKLKPIQKSVKTVSIAKHKSFLNPKNQIQAKKLQRFSQYSQIDGFPEEMQQTILQFKQVLDNSFSPKVKRKNSKQEELTEQVHNLKLLIRQRDKAWQDKMAQTLKKQKTLVVQSFKKMLNQLKKMCQWKRFGNTPLGSEPIFISSKKLFSNYQLQHEFKNSMQEIRNTLMELKILNSQSQTLRDQLQNLRRTLEEERQIKQNIEEQLQTFKITNKDLIKDITKWREKQQQSKKKISLLSAQIQALKLRFPTPSTQEELYLKYSIGENGQKQCSRSTFIESKELRLQRKIKELIAQNYILKDLVSDLSNKIASHQDKHCKQIATLKQVHKRDVEKLNNSFLTKLRLAQQKKLHIHIQQNQVPISFKSTRKSSLQHERPYQISYESQIQAVLYS